MLRCDAPLPKAVCCRGRLPDRLLPTSTSTRHVLPAFNRRRRHANPHPCRIYNLNGSRHRSRSFSSPFLFARVLASSPLLTSMAVAAASSLDRFVIRAPAPARDPRRKPLPASLPPIVSSTKLKAGRSTAVRKTATPKGKAQAVPDNAVAPARFAVNKTSATGVKALSVVAAPKSKKPVHPSKTHGVSRLFAHVHATSLTRFM
jgi:hypothetical protein